MDGSACEVAAYDAQPVPSREASDLREVGRISALRRRKRFTREVLAFLRWSGSHLSCCNRALRCGLGTRPQKDRHFDHTCRIGAANDVGGGERLLFAAGKCTVLWRAFL